MAMTRADKVEMTAVFESAMSNFKIVETLERELIMGQLTRIEEKTIEIGKKVDKTNGSVLRHTEEIFQLKSKPPHTSSDCPQKDIIQGLYDDHQQNLGVSKWKTTVIALAAGFVGAVAAVVAVFEFILKYNPS